MSSPLLAAAELPWRPWSVGGCDAIGRKHVTLFSHSRADLLFRLSRLQSPLPPSSPTHSDMVRHTKPSLFFNFPSHPGETGSAQPEPPSPAGVNEPPFLFFFLTSSHADRRQQHNDNKPLLYFLKKGHFSFPQIAEQKFSK